MVVRPGAVPLLLLLVVLGVLAGPRATVAAGPFSASTPPLPASGHVPLGEVTASGAVRPVVGAVVRPFDPPVNPYGAGHRGVDLAAAPGEHVRAALPGTVAFAGPVAGRGWVTVDHGGGLRTTYGDVVPSVGVDDEVGAGDVIGQLADGARHLDWGARLARIGGGAEGPGDPGDYIDPLSLLERWRPRLTSPARVPRGEAVER